LVEKDGIFQGVITWDELMKVKAEERNIMRVRQLPLKNISVFEDDSILEANKIMTREKIDLVPVVDRTIPTKVVGVLTSEAVSNAYEKSKER